LWGAAVVPAFRGRGIYRALVRARLAHAAARGATLALVHAEPTSSPVLQRLGFGVYGQQRVLAFRPDSADGPPRHLRALACQAACWCRWAQAVSSS
jgi:ribosomal protein S18 acetylase RimI-like enzyme